MARRKYRMDKRAGAAEETRRRIVEACFDLHCQKGIADTTMTEIAGQAGVSVGTVYHHFPRYEDAITACGAHAAAKVPPPGPGVFDGLDSLEDRLKALAAAVFGYFGRLKVFDLIRADRHRYEVVQGFVDQEAAGRLALARAALAPFGAGDRDIHLTAALLDVSVHDELCRAGFTTAEAAQDVAATLYARLKERLAAAPRRRP
ncbi:TetR/AcrR family transcriptional regulator [Pelagibius marinus]|uniref:TetR/AcrR family transcriptional regulator n=1 Tax=Pelagibius marinus TaxID=2762760 RepID=UPI0018733C63|nr:TetR/AcrR family transcriptional regulator [Pelagibius marinus]